MPPLDEGLSSLVDAINFCIDEVPSSLTEITDSHPLHSRLNTELHNFHGLVFGSHPVTCLQTRARRFNTDVLSCTVLLIVHGQDCRSKK